MSVLKYFKNTPGRPSIGRQVFKCNFFFKFAMRSMGKKKPCRPLGGRQGPVAQPTGDRRWAQPTGAAGGLSPPPRAIGGPVAPPAGDRGTPLI